VVDSALFDAKRVGNFQDSQPLLFQGPRSRRCGLGCARPPSGVHTTFPGQGNASGLPLLGVLQFDLGDTKQQTGNQMPHRTVEVNLLCDRDDPYSTLAPICQHVDAFLEVAGQAVKLPDHNGGNLSGKNGGLQLLERFPLYGRPAFVILKPLHRFVPVTLEPGL